MNCLRRFGGILKPKWTVGSIISFASALCLAVATVLFFQNCGVEQPRVESEFASRGAMSPESHKALPADTKCASCHESSRPVAPTVSHNFNHKNPSWAGQDCVTCHADKQTWGTAWTGGQFPHDPFPGTCLECHGNSVPRSAIFIANDPARPMIHTAGVECATCHTSTTKFDVISDWRPAAFQPSGLVGSKTFTIPVVIPTFTGSVMTRPAAIVKSLKLEINHGESQVGDLACITCHTSSAMTGTFAGALFHRNITANPATCVECHTNARPVGAVGTKGFMRHEAVNWVSNTIGAVSRGTANIVGAECIACHLNAPSMPQAGANPVPGSRPFSGASFHLNTPDVSLSSCLDCHAHNRPAGSANFTDLNWKNKTNVGAPPFTTFDLTRHAPNVDCATCHSAPGIANTTAANWIGGYFAHTTANSNCLNCHTASGITSTNHNSFNSNCITCHAGSSLRFPNPVIGDWKVNVTGAPSGSVGEKAVPNAMTCTGVQASLPACKPSSPNVIAKGMDHSSNTNNVSCVNCHGAGVAGSANGKFHTAPVGVANWIAPNAADVANCTKCHDPVSSQLTVASIKNIGMVGSQVKVTTGATPFAGVNHGNALIAGQQCVQCHIAPTSATASTWNRTTSKLHAKLTPAQITTCTECHYMRMPAGALPRKNQVSYKGTHNPQKFTHTSALSMPNVGSQQCASCHTDDGVSWTSATKVSFHNRVTSTVSCNTCHVAPTGVVTSSTTGISFNHGIPANVADCASCHRPSVARVAGRIPTASDWDGAVGAPATYTIPSHVSSGITIPGYTGTHSTNPNCVTCHGTGNYSVITDFDHQGLPAGQDSCISCHLGSKADVSAYIASSSVITMKSLGSRHHPTAKFNGTTLSCVGCHTSSRGANTFTNANGIVYPTTARQGYVSVGCGSVNQTTFACHDGGQQTMIVPTTPAAINGKWR